MDQLGNTAKETGDKVEKMGDRIKNAADGAERQDRFFSVGLTAPVVAVATAATELATSYEEAMNKIQANTGASNKEMEEFKGIAEDIYQAGYMAKRTMIQQWLLQKWMNSYLDAT